MRNKIMRTHWGPNWRDGNGLFWDTGVFSGVRLYWKVIFGHQGVNEVKTCGEVVPDTVRWGGGGVVGAHGASWRVRGGGEARACQSALTPHLHTFPCLSLGISSSFDIIFSTQIYVRICHTSLAICLFFSMVSRPSCKAELTSDPFR